MKARQSETYRGARRNAAFSREGKVPKSTVQYSLGHRNSRCGICTFYYRNTCSKVAGHIDPEYWCRLFEKRSDSA